MGVPRKHWRRSGWTHGLALLVTLLLLPRAHAGLFEDHLRRGERLAAEGDFAAALPELGEAFALRPQPRVMLQIAHAHRRLRQGRAALDCYQRYLALEPRLPPLLRARVERWMAEARAILLLSEPRLEPQVPPPPAPRSAPLHRRPWFWVALGAAAGTLVGLTAGLARPPDPRDNPNYREFTF